MADPDVEGLENSINRLNADARATNAQVNNLLRGHDLLANPEDGADRVLHAMGDYRDNNQGVLNEVPPMRERLRHINDRLESYQRENSWGYWLREHWRKLAIGTVGGLVMLISTCKGYNALNSASAPAKPGTKIVEKAPAAVEEEGPMHFYNDAMRAMKERAQVYKDQERLAREMYGHKLEEQRAKIRAEQKILLGYNR